MFTLETCKGHRAAWCCWEITVTSFGNGHINLCEVGLITSSWTQNSLHQWDSEQLDFNVSICGSLSHAHKHYYCKDTLKHHLIVFRPVLKSSIMPMKSLEAHRPLLSSLLAVWTPNTDAWSWTTKWNLKVNASENRRKSFSLSGCRDTRVETGKDPNFSWTTYTFGDYLPIFRKNKENRSCVTVYKNPAKRTDWIH